MRHYLLLVVGCLAVLSGIHHFARGQVPAVQRERWEYASYTFSFVDRQAFYTVNRGKELLSEKDLESLCRKLGGSFEAGEKAMNVTLFDLLGRDGWELVTSETTDSPTRLSTTYHFKRRG